MMEQKQLQQEIAAEINRLRGYLEKLREDLERLGEINTQLLAALELCSTALEHHDTEADYPWHKYEIKVAGAAIDRAKEVR